jgi:hypothetical protein
MRIIGFIFAPVIVVASVAVALAQTGGGTGGASGGAAGAGVNAGGTYRRRHSGSARLRHF